MLLKNLHKYLGVIPATLDKSFKDFKLYGSILIKIFEVKVSKIKTIQINVTWKQYGMLKDFFGVED